jgi:6-pyruvoyltetrahydropterin/6-carboxytetrahydropterin synthase
MRLGVSSYVDCAHFLPGHPKCGQLHGHTYKVDLTIEGDHSKGMVVDFAEIKADLRRVLAEFDHRHWNDFLEYPSVENICELISRRLKAAVRFPFLLRVWEGHGKFAELQSSEV